MQLILNGEPFDLPGETATVADLISHLGKTGIPVAVELNKELVRKRHHESTPLHCGDAVEVVTLVGGG